MKVWRVTSYLTVERVDPFYVCYVGDVLLGGDLMGRAAKED
jgi:hypothetical protein